MSAPQPVTPFRAIGLIARRELNTRLRTRSFVIGTAVILAILAGYLSLQASLFGHANRARIGLSGQAIGIAAQLRAAGAAEGKDVETSVVLDPDEGRTRVADGALDALVSGSAAELQVLSKSDVDSQLRALLNGVSRQQVLNAKLLEAGQDPALVMRDVEATHVAVTTIEPADPGRDQRLAIGLITVFLLFFGIQTYGAFVAQGVVEEKASRVVEILLSTVRPWQLMLGKVLGLGMVGLVQILILAVAGLAMAQGTGVLTLAGVATGAIAWGILWYVLGFFLYATVYAAAGSLVSRQEDAASVITPVSMVLMIGFVLGFNVLLQNPTGSTVRTLSLIPLFSPILMPGRIALGAAVGWEIALTLVLTLLTASALTWLGSRVYRNAVLHTGSRLGLRAALLG